MHEHGVITRLMDIALEEARRREGRLATVRVRLGALVASTPERFREDFEHVCAELGARGVQLEIEPAPDHPAGVELLSIDVEE
ncbi:MAG: hydrogenase/urease maturation nickel metallochaperone HypA [Byssovorax sp.]